MTSTHYRSYRSYPELQARVIHDSPAVVMALPTVAPPIVFKAKDIRCSRCELFSLPCPESFHP